MIDARRLGGWIAVAVVVGPLLVLPLVAVADAWRAPALLPQQFGLRGLEILFDPRSGVPAAVGLSTVVAVLATGVALLVGWPAARWLVTARRLRAAALALLFVPLLVPPYAAGFGLTTWLLRLGASGSLIGLVVGHLFYVLPYVVLVLAAGFSRRVDQLDEAAATLGAGQWTRLRLITMPAMAPALAVAALLGFVISWGQYGTSLAVGGGRLTLPLVLLPFVGPDPQVAAALTLAFLVPPVAALVLMVHFLPASARADDPAAGMGLTTRWLSTPEEQS
ncbi:MAG: ABC transporter permease subunit [Nitriliruptorales bacterium]|nr:ABC transporter permease subunit [Nitriliruptorales bacterium]